MSVTVLLAALDEYLTAKKDFLTKCGDEQSVVGAKKRFAIALNQYIDWRFESLAEEKRKRSSAQTLKIVDVLTASFDSDTKKDIHNLVDISEELVPYIDALNSAPTPPIQLSKEWVDVYSDWFDGKRKDALK